MIATHSLPELCLLVNISLEGQSGPVAVFKMAFSYPESILISIFPSTVGEHLACCTSEHPQEHAHRCCREELQSPLQAKSDSAAGGRVIKRLSRIPERQPSSPERSVPD